MRKTAPKIVHYKVRPPHTAILDSLGPPTRPHHPAISESATDAAANVGVHFEVVGFESPKSGGCHLAIRNYRGLVGHLRTVPNGSERFRTVQRYLRTVPNGSEAPFVGSRVVRAQLWQGSAGGFWRCRPARFRPAPSTDGESWIDAIRSQLPTFLLLTHLT